jgi:peptidylprolyl isomerase
MRESAQRSLTVSTKLAAISASIAALSVPMIASAQPAATPATAPTAAPAAAAPASIVIEDLVTGTGADFNDNTIAFFASYKGFIQGQTTPFDSTDRRDGKPMEFLTKDVIPGWQKGLLGMKVGGKRRLTIPAGMALGDAGLKDRTGKVIVPPGATLVYEITLDNTLNFIDTVVGTGREVPPNSTLKLYYRGTLATDGTQFDARLAPDQPVEFALNSLVKGWQLGVPGMKIGGKRQLFIPWQLAYGERGSPPRIPGKANLVFDIEVVDIVSPADPNAKPATPPAAPATPQTAPVPSNAPEVPVVPAAPATDPAPPPAPPKPGVTEPARPD